MPDPATDRLLLVVEDDQDDQILLMDALQATGYHPRLEFVQDGQELLDYLTRTGSWAPPKPATTPALILLDLRMPRLDGPAALARIKGDPRLRRIPVVVMSTSWSERDIVQSYDAGVSAFLIKPVTFDKLVAMLRRLCAWWFDTVELPPGPEIG